MAVLTDEEVALVFKMIDSGEEDESVLDELEKASREDADYVIGVMRGIVDTPVEGVAEAPQDTAWKADNAGLDDLAREVFRRAEAEGEPITMEEARLQTAYAPRGTRARLQPNANQYFQPVADFKDVYDTGIRMGHGLFARSNDQQGIEDNVNPLEEMYRTQANPQTGFLGTSKEVGENIFRDPLTALGGPIAKGLFSLGSKLYQPASKLMSGLLGGAGVAGAEVAIEQEGRREQGLPYMGLDETALNVGLGTVLGGASGKLSDVKSNKQALADSPNILGRADDEGIDLVESVVSNPKKAEEKIGEIIMPTPEAVLQAAELLSNGYEDEEGYGELIVVDIGGATTDVHTIGEGFPKRTEVILKGLEEPFAKRTVDSKPVLAKLKMASSSFSFSKTVSAKAKEQM